jgi:hypothetical protein
MTKTIGKIEYISMAEAAEITPYAQDYLSLLCRRNQLKSKKVGRKWYTTREWLNEYLKEKKPGDVIESQESRIKNQESRTEEKSGASRGKNTSKVLSILTMATFVFLIVVFGTVIWQKVNKIEASKSNFVPEEITKVPNENGGYDVYGEGRVKIGEEKTDDNDLLMLNP